MVPKVGSSRLDTSAKVARPPGPARTARSLVRPARARPPPPGPGGHDPLGLRDHARGPDGRTVPFGFGTVERAGCCRPGRERLIFQASPPHLLTPGVFKEEITWSRRTRGPVQPFRGALVTDAGQRSLLSTPGRTGHELQGHRADRTVRVRGCTARVLSGSSEAHPCGYPRL